MYKIKKQTKNTNKTMNKNKCIQSFLKIKKKSHANKFFLNFLGEINGI